MTLGNFNDYQSFVALLRQRKDALGISNADLDALTGFTEGHVDKLLGPTGTKGIGASTFGPLLDALGLSGTLHVDPEKVARFAYRRQRRREMHVHRDIRLSKSAIQRARPVVMGELARKGAAARWKGKTAEERQAFGKFLVEARRRRHAGM